MSEKIPDVAPKSAGEGALLANQRRLENAQRMARLGDWEFNPANGTMLWSVEMYRILGLAADAAGPAAIRERTDALQLYLGAIHPDDREAVGILLRNAAGTTEWFAVDHRIIRSDGEERVVYLRGEPTLDRQGAVERISGTLQDITERKRTEEDLLRTRRKLRALSVHQATIVEEERKRVAREVHDDMGQNLTALQLGLSLIAERYGPSKQLAVDISELQALVSGTIDIVRHLSTRLRPPVLDAGFLPAIEWLAEDFRHRWEIDCVVDIQANDIAFSEPIAATLFRVVQESLNNVAKHAAAKSVTITLLKKHRKLCLDIRDDGRGFDPAVVRQMAGFGLLGMRERVLALGGTLFINSGVGRGTNVAIEFPLLGVAP